MLRSIAVTLCLVALPVAAEPALADLKAALDGFKGRQPLTAELKVTVMHQLGQGDKADVREGEAQAAVRADGTGLHWGFSPAALARQQREWQKTLQDPDAATPLLTAQSEFTLPAVTRHVSAAEHLQRWVAMSRYQGHTRTQYLGHTARILTFQYGIERLSRRDTRYVNNYHGELRIWIDPQGVPLRSEISTRLSGRAFIFVRFSSSTDESREYAAIGDRLITRYSSYHSDAAGAGERSVSRVEYWLQSSAQSE